MSVAATRRHFGLDGQPSHLPNVTSRREVSPEDVQFALANKHRMGWQTLATIRAVNREDLRRHVERWLNPPPVAPPVEKPRVPMPIRVLSAIAQGAARPQEIITALGVTEATVHCAVRRLKVDGYLTGRAGAANPWAISPAGYDALIDAGLFDE